MVRAKFDACAAGVALLVTALGAMAAQEAALDRAISRGPYSPAVSSIISCANTPFGTSVPVARDFEAMLLLWGTHKSLEEYRPSVNAEPLPLQRVYSANLDTSRTLRKAVNADLNNDGEEEVVELLSDGTDVELAIYERTTIDPLAVSPSATKIDSVVFNTEQVAIDSLSLVVGDLDGSKDRQKEMAVSWTAISGADAGKIRVQVIRANSIAHFLYGNNLNSGQFLVTSTGRLFPRLVAGDFLAQGRDQVVLTGYDQATGKVSLDLLEYDNLTHTESVTNALPFVGTALRGAHFSTGTVNPFGGAFISQFNFDDGTVAHMQLNAQNIPLIEALEVNGGDLVDTSADELAFQLMFFDPQASKHVRAQGIQHFTTTRGASNAITSVALNPYGIGAFESTILVGAYSDPLPKFAVTIADVDAIAHKEIVTAIAGHDGNNGPTTGPMTWAARKVHTQNSPDFTWQNLSDSVVSFVDRSHGDIATYEWDFGDGSGTSSDKNPRHTFANTGTYSVSQTTTDIYGIQFTVGQQVLVKALGDGIPQYAGNSPPYTYLIDDPLPNLTGTSGANYLYTNTDGNTAVKVAVGDMNRDALPEVIVAVSENGFGVFTHVFTRQAGGDFGVHTLQNEDAGTAFTAMELLASDFDGDSLNAVVSNTFGDCRTVEDVSIRSLTWMPPYFVRPQSEARRFALYGTNSTTGTSNEHSSESSFSNSISLEVGFEYELEAPVVAIKLAEVDAKVTLGAEWQDSKGETHGDENEVTIDEGFSIGNDTPTIDQEGLLYSEKNTSDCYSYNLATAAGVVPSSNLRSCGVKKDVIKVKTAINAVDWNLLDGEPFPIQVPAHWVPMQRDWASLALFHSVKGGSDPATPISFTGHLPGNATDGVFFTDVESTSAVNNPYLEIDLGFVRDIQSVRVFPSADVGSGVAPNPIDFKNAVKDLEGFRLYASIDPFSGDNPPTAAAVTTFVPDGISTFVQDTGVEAVYRTWNVWTFSSYDGSMLRARYLRLQKPTHGIPQEYAKIRISEIQVFGDTHTEPQFYPQAVCDPVVGDGFFTALVYDNVNRLTKTIQVRGDMLWTGATNLVSNNYDTGIAGCSNDTSVGPSSPKVVGQGPIWQGISIAAGGSNWTLSNDSTHTDATSTSNEWSARAGVELDTKFGAGALLIVNAAYEATLSGTKSNQSSTSTGIGFEVGGEIGGFNKATYGGTCAYFPRPYAFQATNYSNSGWRQDTYVTDYVVRQPNTLGIWQRGSLLARCSDNSADDGIFYDDLE